MRSARNDRRSKRLRSPLAAAAVVAALLLGGAGGVARAGEPSAAPEAGTATAAPEGALVFPGVRVFAKERRVEADAAFAIVDPAYALEYLAVASNGKLHESLLELRGEPEKLHLGLLLAGLEPRPEVVYQGEPRELAGPRVAIEVEWRVRGGASVRVPAEDLVRDVVLGGTLERKGFAFTGSRFLPGRAPGPGGLAPGAAPRTDVFAASASGSAIALYHDPDAILDWPDVSGGDVPLLTPTFRLVEVSGWVPGDERFRPAAGVPPHGTPAVLHLRPK
jgi:hypothetical protein